MRRNLFKCLLLFVVPLTLSGCGKSDPPITNKEESTVIKNATSTDGYLSKKDYKSIAYAYIYNIKEGLKSYESETNGTVKAKVLFFDYNIKYNSVTCKNNNVFYSKDYSTSSLMTIKNEFYMADKEKILVSKDLKKYKVHTLEDYHKVSYTPDQYTVMGYVFNNESITNAELVSDKDGVVSIKYTLDNELSTHLVKVDLKSSGDLSNYPKFEKIEITLSMKKDFTPVSYSINAIYEASRKLIGTTKVTQKGECLFSKVNESITIPNELFLAEQLGIDPSRVVIDDEERTVKDELLDSVMNLDFENGVNVAGNLKLNLLDTEMVMGIDSNVTFDMKKLAQDKIYHAFNFYAELEGDQNLGTLISLASAFAGDAIAQYKDILEGFKSLEVVYDGNGSLYLIPKNIEDVTATIAKIKLTDIVDLVLKNLNIYNLINGSNNDFVTFEKAEGGDENNYTVNIILNEETNTAIREGLNSFFENPTYSLIKTLIGYKDFDSIKISVEVANAKAKKLNASFNYLKQGEEEDSVVVLATLSLEAKEQGYNFEDKITYAEELYGVYESVQELKARVKELLKNVYVSKGYLANVEKALEDFEALTDTQKGFMPRYAKQDLEKAKKDVTAIITFMNALTKYDLDHLTNADILALEKDYRAEDLNTNLLSTELGEEKYQKITSLGECVDYTILDNAIDKLVGEDENSWGLTEAEIRGIKLLFDIAKYESTVSSQIWMKLLMKGNMMSVEDFESKINNLYNNLP